MNDVTSLHVRINMRPPKHNISTPTLSRDTFPDLFMFLLFCALQTFPEDLEQNGETIGKAQFRGRSLDLDPSWSGLLLRRSECLPPLLYKSAILRD